MAIASYVDTSYVDITPHQERLNFMNVPFDPLDIQNVIEILSDSRPSDAFQYIVTPNVDHIVRLKGNRDLSICYDNAWLSLCDSSPVSALARLLDIYLPIVTGSDLTETMFREVIKDGDHIALIVADKEIAQKMRCSYPKLHFHWHVPPHNLLEYPNAIEGCVRFSAKAQSRFVFIAVGSPQSELIAYGLSCQPDAHGIALCCGASIEFLVGSQVRAPAFLRQSGFEWLHRLMQNPRRLWRRYVFGVVPLFRLFSHEVYTRLRGHAR